MSSEGLHAYPDDVGRELLRTYLESRGGLDPFWPNPGLIEDKMQSLGIWRVAECDGSTHQAPTCRQVMGFLTPEGVRVTEDMMQSRVKGVDRERLERELGMIPRKLLNLFASIISRDKELSLTMEVLFKVLKNAQEESDIGLLRDALYPQDFGSMPDIRSLIHYTEVLAETLKAEGLGYEERDHVVKGWRRRPDLFATSAEVGDLLLDMTHAPKDFLQESASELKNLLSVPLAQLSLLSMTLRGGYADDVAPLLESKYPGSKDGLDKMDGRLERSYFIADSRTKPRILRDIRGDILREMDRSVKTWLES